MNKTQIEYVDYTWNPITGCLHGCDYCYARKMANGRVKNIYLANRQVALRGILHEENPAEIVAAARKDPFYPRFWEKRLNEPAQNKTPQRIFVCDMGELFGPWLPVSWVQSVFDAMKMAPQHTYLLFTKQYLELQKLKKVPDSWWINVSCTDNTQFKKAMQYMRSVDAKVKGISFEPLLDEITGVKTKLMEKAGINWVIIGPQTKPLMEPKLQWVLDIVDAADKLAIPVFFKDALRPCLLNGSQRSRELYENFRQELPS